jgi:hypothetical protein
MIAASLSVIDWNRSNMDSDNYLGIIKYSELLVQTSTFLYIANKFY